GPAGSAAAMTQQQKARYLTIAVIGTVVVVIAGQKAGWKLPTGTAALRPPEPRDTIYQMLDAARVGDAAAYLRCFTGQMEATLGQSQSEMGAQAFSQYLVSTNKEVKGVALSEPAALTDREVRVRVEYVYQDRNEVQQ